MKQRHNHSDFSNFEYDPTKVAATSVDWVKKGAVTPVQD
jgi:hypothetical protein